MKHLKDFIKRYQLISFITLTYAFSWALWLLFQPLYLGGEVISAPFIMLGIFGPALVSILLSAIIKPGKKSGNRKSAPIAFILVWISSFLLFTLDQIINEGRSISPLLLAVSAVVALLPAFVLSMAFYSAPGIRHLLATLVKPKGALGYYFLALLLFPVIWGLGIIITRALGMEVPKLEVPTVGLQFVGVILLAFFYTFIFTGLSEEPGWRGFALPRLQAKLSPLVASLILGVIWAVWHAPARFSGFESKSVEDTIVAWIFIVFMTIIFTWIYNRTTRSLLATVLLHTSMNITSNFIPLTIGAILILVVFLVFAIVRDRMWRKLPPEDQIELTTDTY